MYECKNCGRVLRYDIRLKCLKCDFCDGTFSVQSFPDKSYYKGEYEANVFICSQCGGEIVTQSNDMTGICSYCGTTQVFQCRTDMVQRPKYIIPFQNEKSACKTEYERAVRKAFYAPKELKDPRFIDNIRGIYMPYWVYEARYEQNVAIRGLNKKTRQIKKDTVTSQEYSMTGEYQGEFLGMGKDASSWYSDEISDNLRPFRMIPQSGLQPFNPAYLCGFFGETADEGKSENPALEEYERTAVRRANLFLKKKAEEKYNVIDGRDQVKKPAHEDSQLALLPVWFLSYRKGNRVSYSVMNGQSGVFAAEFPIDIKKFLFCTLALAAALFLVLNLFWVMRPEDVAMAAAISAMWAIRFVASDLTEVTRKEYEMAPPERRRYAIKPERIVRTFTYKMLIPYAIVAFSVIAEVSGLIERYPGGILMILPLCMTIWALISAYKERKYISRCRSVLQVLHIKTFPLHFPAYAALWLALGIQITFPAKDTLYYLAAFACMAMSLLSILGVVLSYNRMASRKMPQFDHKGGDDSAKTE